jgi:hypothetical protein
MGGIPACVNEGTCRVFEWMNHSAPQIPCSSRKHFLDVVMRKILDIMYNL